MRPEINVVGTNSTQGGQPAAELYGGIALGVAAVVAIAIFNSPLGPQYLHFLETTAEIRVGSLSLSKSIESWINDGLMAIFFLLVTLEIKREVLEGSLRSLSQATLPIIAAVGGFLFPPLIFAAFNKGETLRGWAIPSATDIAFVVGICAVLGHIVPPSLRVLLLTLAIVDDLLAILVIAAFYTAELSATLLLAAAAGVTGLAILNRFDVRTPAPYVLLGVFTWVCVLQSGVHATLAGVATGLAIPHTRHGCVSLLDHVEHALKPYVNYGILPLFAFANAGVQLTDISVSLLLTPLVAGIALGLFLGKQIGVFAVSAAAITFGWVKQPSAATLGQLYGVAILTGIGFTMSLFIGTLAFNDETTLAIIRLAVLLGSLLSAIVGVLVLIAASRAASPRALPFSTEMPRRITKHSSDPG